MRRHDPLTSTVAWFFLPALLVAGAVQTRRYYTVPHARTVSEANGNGAAVYKAALQVMGSSTLAPVHRTGVRHEPSRQPGEVGGDAAARKKALMLLALMAQYHSIIRLSR